jgi:hypothetical protein
MGHVRSKWAHSIIYIDDLLSLSRPMALGLLQGKLIQETFLKWGWVFKPSKSSKREKFLGLIIDSVSIKFCIRPDKLTRLIEGAKYLVSVRKLPVRVLASWVGLLQSCRLAIGPLVSIMCRSIHDLIYKAKFWSSFVFLTHQARFQEQWWSDSLHSLDEYDIVPNPSVVQFSVNFPSDAGDLGFYVYNILSKLRF